jgi:hypothetical protein
MRKLLSVCDARFLGQDGLTVMEQPEVGSKYKYLEPNIVSKGWFHEFT